MPFFIIRKKVHWSDSDPAGVVWFPNFLGWFEDVEEELYASLGRPRQALLNGLEFAMPRVEAQIRFASPARPGETIRIGIDAVLVNPRRLQYTFDVREDGTNRLMAYGSVRVACVDAKTFTPRDFPREIGEMIAALPALIEQQRQGKVEIPWT